jgi:hypothetical protein
MQTKGICNAMINGKKYGCSVLVCKMQLKKCFCIFEINMNENENSDKVNRKVFFIIKSGSGFMGSQMHSLTKDYTINIKDCNRVHIQMNSYGHHVLYRDVLVIHLSHTPPRREFNLITSVLR